MLTKETGSSKEKSATKSQFDSESSAAGVTVGISGVLRSLARGNTSSSLSEEYPGDEGKVIVRAPIASLAD